METPNEPIVLGPGEGRTFPFGRRTMISKVDEEDTEDVAIFETMPEPGVPAAQPHRHWEAVEAFYVLGGLAFVCAVVIAWMRRWAFRPA